MKARVAFVVLIALTVAGCGGRPGSKVSVPPAQQAQAPAQQTPSGAPAPPPDQAPSAGGETEAPQASEPSQPPQSPESPESQPSAISPAETPGGAAPTPPAPPGTTSAQPQPTAQPAQPATPAPSPAPSPPGPENLLTWYRGAIVRVWPQDTDPEVPVTQILDDRHTGGPLWRSRKGASGPFTFVFELPAEATIDSFGFLAGDDSDTRTHVVHVTVSTQSADTGFVDAGTFTLRDDWDEQDFPLRPSRVARWIRVTIEPRSGGLTELSTVLVYGKESRPTNPPALTGTWLYDDKIGYGGSDDPLFGPSGRLPATVRYQQYREQYPNLFEAIQNRDSVSGIVCSGTESLARLWQGVRSGNVVQWHDSNPNLQEGSGVINAEGTLFVGHWGGSTFLAIKVNSSDSCQPLPSAGSGKKVLVLYVLAEPGGKFYPPPSYPADYPGYRFMLLHPTLLQASDLADADSVVFGSVCGARPLLTDWQRNALMNFVRSGHKLIIHDADWCGAGSEDLYDFLPYPFTTSNPGAQGASGRLMLVEPNSLGTSDQGDAAHFIDFPAFVASDPQLGDADVVTSQDAHWCGHLFGINVLNANGFVHMYARYGTGLIIYNGLDADDELKPEYNRLLQLELAQPPSADLPCTQSVAAKFLVAPSQEIPFIPGRAQSIPLHLEVLANLGYAGTVSLTATPPEATGWDTRLSTAQVTLKGDTAPVDVTLGVPAAATQNTYVLKVAGSDTSGHTASAVITLVAKAPPKNVQVTEEACKIRITMASGILFDFDKDNLKPGAEAVLADIKTSIIDKHPGARLIIEGHTDDRGTQDYNLKLSGRRAQSVTGWLSRQGIPASRLETKGYGKIKPRYPNNTDENRARNRRVEIIVVTCPGP